MMSQLDSRRGFLRGAFGVSAVCLSAPHARAAAASAPPLVRDLKITLLSTGIGGGPSGGLGEWGFSALVEADGRRILYDTGAAPELVLNNAKALKIDLHDVETVVLSHNHPDHVGGLLSLRAALKAKAPSALSRAEVGAGVFTPRMTQGPSDRNALNAIRTAYEQGGGVFEVHDAPFELAPGLWMTGPVPRRTREQNWQASVTVQGPDGPMSDSIAEETALIIRTPDGLVILTGCGHAGIVNIVTYARLLNHGAPVLAIVGGLHLAEATPARVDWTAQQLRGTGLRYLLTAHCSGIAATERLRRALGLNASAVALGAVGSVFSPKTGIQQPLSAL
jgi:7,8-dihydropterin-6-yl-methyl-4-(beta-D-ribofuranosyl)aminobenzene 5'-phosphate synthase